jgi:hypothetical protein
MPSTAKTKPTYTRRSSTGGYATLLLLLASAILSVTEFRRWYRGHETHLFSVEKGVSHTLQINLDIVIPMGCADLHVNVQDASGDRILAGDLLRKDPTSWNQWVNAQGVHLLDHLSVTQQQELERDTHPGHVLSEVRRTKRKFRRTPRGGRGGCRIFGSLEGNKVQGDFHITARGHGYMEWGAHLDHEGKSKCFLEGNTIFSSLYFCLCRLCLLPEDRFPITHSLRPIRSPDSTISSPFSPLRHFLPHQPNFPTNTSLSPHPAFNFSHIINELSFGPLYPSLLNPLDRTYAVTPTHFHKYQYYLSVVPTIYTRWPGTAPRSTVFTNQYAVTSSSQDVPEQDVPGIFFKFDIEPILLTVMEEREGVLRLVIRIVNVVSGVLVAGGWVYQLLGWVREVLGGRKRGGTANGALLHGRKKGGIGGGGGDEDDDDD